ncbi:response regulator [Nibrella saemangeumensis]|uniref:Response regulator n=1 Tax=Nibrella saemangeumensis TaxID=1084526 RepID=A0ABP8NT02_9BACT
MPNNLFNAYSKQRVTRTPVLVVEDNADQWTIIQGAIKECFPEVEAIWVSDADQALAYLEETKTQAGQLPKLIFLDLYLPQREDGWKLLKQLKDPAMGFSLLPVVVLSHSSQPEDVEEAYDFWLTSYIVKPLDYDQWISALTALRNYWWNVVTLPGPQK